MAGINEFHLAASRLPKPSMLLLAKELLRMKPIYSLTIMKRITVMLNGNPQLALVLHEVCSEFNRSIKQVKRWKAVMGLLWLEMRWLR